MVKIFIVTIVTTTVEGVGKVEKTLEKVCDSCDR